MNTQEINAALAALTHTSWDLEAAYIENGGEITAETEEMEAKLAAVKELLTTEGVDSLGRWLKAKQDEIAAAKAEKAAADARIKALQRTEEYIKSEISRVLIATDTEKVKGTYYSFAQATSTKSSVNQEAIDAKYLAAAEKAIRKAKVPEYIQVSLKSTATALKEAEALEFLEITETPSVKFTKPRAAKE